MSDEERWGVGNREGALSTLDTRMRNDGSATDGIVYYPGSGADILHALFASWSRCRYFVFVDPGAGNDLAQSLDSAIKESKVSFTAFEAQQMLGNIGIKSRPKATWMFGFKGARRILYWFNTDHLSFVAANRQFQCDVLFDKDFWETPENVELDSVLTLVKRGGFYTTNAAYGVFSEFLAVLGLSPLTDVHLNKNQYLYKKTGDSRKSWPIVRDCLSESRQIAMNGIVDLEPIATTAALIKVRIAQDNVIPLVHCNSATRKILVNAYGPEWGFHADEIDAACS